MNKLAVQSIEVFPIKSLDGVLVSRAEAIHGGGLTHDRRYALIDATDRFVTAKRIPAIQRIRADYRIEDQAATFVAGEHRFQGSLVTDRARLERWFSERLKQDVSLIENSDSGFPDDEEAGGPTMVGSASLQTAAHWFELPEAEARRRFRTNIIVTTSAPFAEDGWLGAWAGQPTCIQMGGAQLALIRVCARCAVPAREASSGETTPDFATRFQKRRADIPVDVDARHFDHFYRYSLNTVVVSGGRIQVGDVVRVLN